MVCCCGLQVSIWKGQQGHYSGHSRTSMIGFLPWLHIRTAGYLICMNGGMYGYWRPVGHTTWVLAFVLNWPGARIISQRSSDGRESRSSRAGDNSCRHSYDLQLRCDPWKFTVNKQVAQDMDVKIAATQQGSCEST